MAIAPHASESDALVVVDLRHNTLAAAGPFADRWPRGQAAMLAPVESADRHGGIARIGGHLFRVVTVPLTLGDAPIGALYLAASIDDDLAAELDRLGSRLSGLDETQRAAVEALTKGIVAKLLHDPTVRLKDAAGTAKGDRLSDALRDLFDL